MALAPWEQKAIWVVLWFEVIANFVNGALAMVSPLSAIAPTMTAAAAASVGLVGLEGVRWFGSMNLVVGYLLLRTMHAPEHLPLLLEALCIGDLLYLASLTPFALSYGELPGIVLPYALTVVMFVARLRLLVAQDKRVLSKKLWN
jgi:hypothetical protein